MTTIGNLPFYENMHIYTLAIIIRVTTYPFKAMDSFWAWCSMELVNHPHTNHTYSRVTSDEERMMGFALHGPKYLSDREVCGDISVTNQSGMNTTRTNFIISYLIKSYPWPILIIFSYLVFSSLH